MAIPKKIFYVWGANEKKKRDVELCILSWRQILSDYEIIEINENSIEYFNFQEELKNNKWFKTVYENKLFAYVADYIRIKTLHDNGGIYLDTDVSVLKSFEEYLEEPAFVGIQSDSSLGKSNLEPAILGAQKGNKILEEILKFYNDKIWELPIYTMPQIFDYVLDKINGEIFYPPKKNQQVIKLENLTIYPEKYFIPFRAGQTFSIQCIESETTTIHWFGGSWVKSNIREFLDNKHKENLETLLNRCFSSKTIVDNPFIKIERANNKYNVEIDFHWICRFKYIYYGNCRYLTLFVLGHQIKLFKH